MLLLLKPERVVNAVGAGVKVDQGVLWASTAISS